MVKFCEDGLSRNEVDEIIRSYNFMLPFIDFFRSICIIDDIFPKRCCPAVAIFFRSVRKDVCPAISIAPRFLWEAISIYYNNDSYYDTLVRISQIFLNLPLISQIF